MLKLNKVATMPSPPANKGSLWYNSTLGMWGWTDEFGTFWSIGEQCFRLTADIGTPFTTATLGDVTGALFPLKNGVQYGFMCYIAWQGNNAASKLKVGFTCPAFTFLSAQALLVGATAGGTADISSGAIIASGGSVTIASTGVINQTSVAQLYGIIKPSTDGNFQVQAANAGSNNITIKAGTHGKLWVT